VRRCVDVEATECGGSAEICIKPLCRNTKSPKGGGCLSEAQRWRCRRRTSGGGLQPRNRIKGVRFTLLYVGYTTKYLKKNVHPLMPTKLKGMTSLEIAIIVAIVLIIAIAVGWYLYTTFAAAGQQSGLVITSTKACTDGKLYLNVVPQGAAQVVIVGVEFAGKTTTITTPVSSATTVTVDTGLQLQAGQVLTGRVILSSGAMAPFTATVVVCQ